MPISRTQLVHIGTKRTSGSDVNTPVTWSHDGVKQSSSYSYVLTAFDVYGNESDFSSVKPFTAGDNTPPGPITSTSTISGYKSIEYIWTNPVDLDFVGAKIYGDLSKTIKINELGGRTPGSKVSWTLTTNTDSETKSIYVSTYDHNRNESVTPVKITGVSLAPPDNPNTEDTITLSIIDTNNREYQSEAFLSETAGRTFRVKIISSTTLTFDSTHRLFYYDVNGVLYGQETPVSDGGGAGNRRYRSANLNFATWAEGRGAIILKGLDINGAVVSGSMTMFVDRTVPTISTMTIDGGVLETNDRAVDVALTYSDLGSGIEAVQVSTALSLVSGNWRNVSTPTGTVRVSYNLPNIEKVYTLYGWAKDRAGNVSARKTSGNTTYYRKLKDDPVGSITFYKSDGLTPLAKNKNGWFKENVDVHYTAAVPSGSTANINKVYYRTNVNDAGWGGFTLNTIAPPDPNPVVTTLISTEATGPYKGVYVEFYSVNILNLTGGNAAAHVPIDKTAPTMSKANFWNTALCKSLNRESILWWKETAGTDSISGLQNTYIYRASSNSWPNAHTIKAVINGQNWMIDDEDKLETGKSYYYWGRFNDNADNLSATSSPIGLKSSYDWEYAYRNWISNGSFERYSTSGGVRRAADWTWTRFISATSNVAPEGYYGQNSLIVHGYDAIGSDFQSTFIHIPDDNRQFVLSGYYKKKTGSVWGSSLRLRVRFYSPDGTLVQTNPASLVLSSASSWTQFSYTFSKGSGATVTIVSSAASASIQFFIQDIDGTKVVLDGIQWEEGTVPTRFNDNQVTTAQRINVGTIDANHIRAGVIHATLIKAGAIVATAIAANAITADKIIANAITSDKILARSVSSDKIAATGIHVKSGASGAPLITVGDSSDPTNQSYTVLKPDSMYYHPRGYGASERWHFMKHYEHGDHIELNRFQTFKRRFIAPDGSSFTPEYQASLSMWTDDDNTATDKRTYNICMAYSTASQIRVNVIVGNLGANFFTRRTKVPNQNISAAGSYTLDVSTAGVTTAMAGCGWVNYTIPWAGPIGTLQRVSWRMEGSHDNATWVGTTYFQKIYDGTAQSISYRQPLCHKNLNKPTNKVGMRYFKISYYQNNNGPTTINWGKFQWPAYFGGTTTWTFLEGSSATGYDTNEMLANYQAWDGFLNY